MVGFGALLSLRASTQDFPGYCDDADSAIAALNYGEEGND